MSTPTDSFEPGVTELNYLDVLSTVNRDINFIDESEQLLFSEARMGQEVLGFLNTEAGRLMRALIKEDVIDCTSQLKTTRPWRKRRIEELQSRIRQGETILFYLADIIQRGEHAYAQMHTDGES